MIKYCANYTFLEVKPVTVLRETDQCVWLKSGMGERRAFKVSGYDCYFDSRRQAIDFLRRRAKEDLRLLNNRMQELEQDIRQINELELEG